ncbi:MAG: efflux RND transporter periplasmic adaptor subunit [Persicimonas sp.]
MRTITMQFATLALAGLLAGLGGCDLAGTDESGGGDESNQTGTDQTSADKTSADKTIMDRLEFSQARSTQTETLARLPAEVVMAEHNAHRFGPTVRARLVEWQVAPGDQVEVGDALATLVSLELTDLEATAAELSRVVSERQQYVQARREDVAAGVAAISAVEQAELSLAEARAQLGAVRRQLRVRKSGQLESENGNAWSWVAPMAGRVGEVTCTPGGLYGAESSCVELLEASRAELRVEVPARLLDRTEADYSVAFAPNAAAPGAEPVEMDLVRRAASLDADSRTQAHFFRPAADSTAQPGLLRVGAAGLATLHVPAPEGVVLVPRLAVTELGGQPHVFVQADGELPTPVAVERRGQVGGDLLIYAEDLAVGARVVSRGAFLLKSRLALE